MRQIQSVIFFAVLFLTTSTSWASPYIIIESFAGLKISPQTIRTLQNAKLNPGSNTEGDLHHHSIANFGLATFHMDSHHKVKDARNDLGSEWLASHKKYAANAFHDSEIRKALLEVTNAYYHFIPKKIRQGKERQLSRFIQVKLAENIANYEGQYEVGGGGLVPHQDTSGGFLATLLLSNTFNKGGDMTIFTIPQAVAQGLFTDKSGRANHWVDTPLEYRTEVIPGTAGHGYFIDESTTDENITAHGNTPFSGEAGSKRRIVIVRFFPQESKPDSNPNHSDDE